MDYRFEWDHEKAAANVIKHGVSFEEAATVFDDSEALNVADPDHSVYELRYLLIGMSSQRRVLVLACTERPPNTRIISARLANQYERGIYGKAKS